MNHTDICPLDNQPCFVFLDVDEAHWRCGTGQCIGAAPGRDVRGRLIISNELDACGYYQGPLGVETDQPQIFDYTIVRLLILIIGSLGIWAAIWKSAAIVSSLIPPA